MILMDDALGGWIKSGPGFGSRWSRPSLWRAPRALSLAGLRIGQPVEPILHLAQLALERVDLAALCRCFVGLPLRVAPRKRREHRRKSPLEHFHIATDLILEGPERADSE